MEDMRKMVKGIKERDEFAFNLLYKQYYKLLKHIIFNIVKNISLAEELVQESFLRIYVKIDMCDENKNFKYWIIQIAKNLTYDYLEKEKNRKCTLNNELVNNWVKSEEAIIYNQDKITRFLNVNLSSEEFDIFILHFYHGMKFREIAREYKETTSTITSKYSRTLKKLRKLSIDKENFYE